MAIERQSSEPGKPECLIFSNARTGKDNPDSELHDPGVMIGALGYSLEDLRDEFDSRYGKGPYHADALFRRLYSHGDAEVTDLEAYRAAPALAQRVRGDFRVHRPPVSHLHEDEGTRKFTLLLHDGALTESVMIPMAEWNTLCISSQVGCGRGCTFCETARMGLIRNLRTEEIIAQWASTRFDFGDNPRNIVFMGMGEPFDNFEAVIRAVDILSDSRGAAIPKRRISISTSGHVPGIRRLTELDRLHPAGAYRTIHLAVSLNAPDDRIRNEIMPINRIWPMAELKKALMESPQSGIKDALYFEYVVIPGVNHSVEHAEKLVEWMDGMVAKVNLIPFHPTASSDWDSPDEQTMNNFHQVIRSSGRECRTRQSRGQGIEAACGMLGRLSRRKISP